MDDTELAVNALYSFQDSHIQFSPQADIDEGVLNSQSV